MVLEADIESNLVKEIVENTIDKSKARKSSFDSPLMPLKTYLPKAIIIILIEVINGDYLLSDVVCRQNGKARQRWFYCNPEQRSRQSSGPAKIHSKTRNLF